MAQTSEQTKTLTQTNGGVSLAQNRKPVNFTMSAIPFAVWKAVMDAATNRQVPAKQIWIEAACKFLDIPIPTEDQMKDVMLAAASEINALWRSRPDSNKPNDEEVAAIIAKHMKLEE